MARLLARLRAGVTPDDVVRAMREYDRLGPRAVLLQGGV